MWNITWELFLEIGIMKLGYKCLGRIWRVPSLFRNFLGIFLCMEMGFVASYVHCPGVHSNFPRVQRLTHGAGAVGQLLLLCRGPDVPLRWTASSSPLGPREPSAWKKRRRRERAAVADAWAILGSTHLNGCDTIGLGP